AAMDQPMAVSQNLVVADRAGDFAWQVIGSVVRRRNHTGRVPYPGSEPEYGWQGWIDRLPGEHAPERGYVYSANARPEHPLASAISTDYVPPWRHGRIAGLLEGMSEVTPADMSRMHLDAKDTFAEAFLPRMLDGVVGSTPEAKQCRDLLAGWDAMSVSDAVEPAVFAVFQREVLREALVDELGEDDFRLYLGTVSPGRNVLMTEIDAFLQDRPAEVDRALHATCTWMAAEYGSDASKWTWGEMHPLVLQHPFGAQSSMLKGWNMEEVPWFGSGSTVAAAGWSWRGGPLKATWIQSMRLVMPLSDLGASTLVHPGGQSGHPKHPNYADQFERFVDGETVPLWFDDEDVAAHAEHTLVLVPR
ncbi:MAG: penicillin acylase family protein, partial [Deltaproteobacteria bacterium]|nr:penicillin acylase family protein [Deltaproteobacteria bacterium]